MDFSSEKKKQPKGVKVNKIGARMGQEAQQRPHTSSGALKLQSRDTK